MTEYHNQSHINKTMGACTSDADCAGVVRGACVSGACQLARDEKLQKANTQTGLHNITVRIGRRACRVKYWYATDMSGRPNPYYASGTVEPGNGITFEGPSPADQHLALIIRDVATNGQRINLIIADSYDIDYTIDSCNVKEFVYHNVDPPVGTPLFAGGTGTSRYTDRYYLGPPSNEPISMNTWIVIILVVVFAIWAYRRYR